MKFLAYSGTILKDLKLIDFKKNTETLDYLKELDASYSKINLNIGFLVMPKVNISNQIPTIKECASLKLQPSEITNSCKTFMFKLLNTRKLKFNSVFACNNFIEAEIFLGPYYTLDDKLESMLDQTERIYKSTFELKKLFGNCECLIVWYENHNFFELDIPVIKSNACLHEFHIMKLNEMYYLKIITNKYYTDIHKKCNEAFQTLQQIITMQ